MLAASCHQSGSDEAGPPWGVSPTHLGVPPETYPQGVTAAPVSTPRPTTVAVAPGATWLPRVLLANLVWLVLLALGGVVIAGSELPDRFAPVVALLPSAALGDSLRVALVHGSVSLSDWAVLVVWGALATALARRLFRWSD